MSIRRAAFVSLSILLAACGDGDPTGSPPFGTGGAAGENVGLGGEPGSVSGASGSGAGDSGASGSGAGGDEGGGAGGSGFSGEGGESGSGGAAGDGGDSGAAGASGEGGSGGYPALLSQTGLYADLSADRLAPGVRAYRPAYELWADGATKRRFVKLPEGAQIDSSEPDYLVYPSGTQLWKEFSKDGERIETRMLKKTGDSWIMISYLWNEALTDAVAVPEGERNARGTTHDVPDQTMCVSCHAEMPDRVLGFTLLQLAHDDDGAGVTLSTLVDEDKLTHPPASALTLPGDPATRAALGYLHANCGHCHHERSPIFERTPIELLLGVRGLETLEATSIIRSTVGVEPMFDEPEASAVIAPGDPSDSALYLRMQQRGTDAQMPPLATTEPDDEGLALVRAFIEGLAQP